MANFALAPLDGRRCKRELLGTGKAANLLRRVAGSSGGGDRVALEESPHRALAPGLVDFPEVAELDLNPILAGPTGCVAVDVRIRIAPSARHPSHEDVVTGSDWDSPR